jgi:VanZ family protein
MALIFTISSFSLRRTPLPKLSDKPIHFVEYAVLAALVTFALRRTRESWTARRVALVAALFAAVYGATDEIHQLYVPHRSASVYDWVADALGAAAMAALLAYGWRKTTKETRGADDPALPRQDP